MTKQTTMIEVTPDQAEQFKAAGYHVVTQHFMTGNKVVDITGGVRRGRVMGTTKVMLDKSRERSIEILKKSAHGKELGIVDALFKVLKSGAAQTRDRLAEAVYGALPIMKGKASKRFTQSTIQKYLRTFIQLNILVVVKS